jgi:hypothetical protein
MNLPPADYDPKPFFCRCGWILGESYRELNQRITQLRIYRCARAPECGLDLNDTPKHVKFSVTRLNDGAVICGHCGSEESWYANQSAIAEMLERKYIRRLEVCGE